MTPTLTLRVRVDGSARSSDAISSKAFRNRKALWRVWFGNRSANMSPPIRNAPFFCVHMWPLILRCLSELHFLSRGRHVGH